MRDDIWMKSTGEKINRELGVEIISFLNDASVTEIMLNQDGTVWIDHMGEGMSRTGVVMTRERAMLVIGSVAAYKHTTVNEKRPLLSANLPGGQRFQAMTRGVKAAPSRLSGRTRITRPSLRSRRMSETGVHVCLSGIIPSCSTRRRSTN